MNGSAAEDWDINMSAPNTANTIKKGSIHQSLFAQRKLKRPFKTFNLDLSERKSFFNIRSIRS